MVVSLFKLEDDFLEVEDAVEEVDFGVFGLEPLDRGVPGSSISLLSYHFLLAEEFQRFF